MSDRIEQDVRRHLDRLAFNIPITKIVHNHGNEYSVYVRRGDGEERLIGTWDAEKKEFV